MLAPRGAYGAGPQRQGRECAREEALHNVRAHSDMPRTGHARPGLPWPCVGDAHKDGVAQAARLVHAVVILVVAAVVAGNEAVDIVVVVVVVATQALHRPTQASRRAPHPPQHS